MANSREDRKRLRLQKLTATITAIKKSKKEVDINKLISMMIIEHTISKKTAVEEIEAVMNYDF